MAVVLALLAIVVALLAVLVLGLLRQQADVLRALEDLGAGLEPGGPGPRRRSDPAPAAAARTGRPAVDISGTALDGGAVALRVVGAAHDTLLLFLSSGCTTCQAFWQSLREHPGLGLPDRIRVVAVTKDLADESPSALAELVPARGAEHVLSSRAWLDYEVPGSPYVVLVAGDEGRVVGEGTAASWPQVADMLAQATGDLAFAGEPTPRTRKAGRDMAVERDTDAELLRAGIRPGDPSLYPSGGSADAPADGPAADGPAADGPPADGPPATGPADPVPGDAHA